MADWKQILAGVAPAIATAVGGPLAGAAVSTLGRTLLGKEKATEQEVADAVMSLAPSELALKLKEANNFFLIENRKLDVREQEIHQQDRASARDRETKTADPTPRRLAYLILGGFVAMVTYVIGWGLAKMDTTQAAMAGTLIGFVSAKAEQIVAYYFGSSAGSKAKDDMLAGVVKR